MESWEKNSLENRKPWAAKEHTAVAHSTIHAIRFRSGVQYSRSPPLTGQPVPRRSSISSRSLPYSFTV